MQLFDALAACMCPTIDSTNHPPSQYPETATFLTADERAHVVKILRADAKGLATHYDFKFVLQALFDYKSWVQAGVYMG